ncbi:AAA family ATPase [Streptomyces sp. NPDC048172]|uniref:helix-turn-helix transcriptional regulator n=1 Tax=Streptomyces sp. NPDC048172 TaxID=3365505 RepID=UPI003722D298
MESYGGRVPFVGRTAELRALDVALDGGGSAVVDLTGDPGTGKSRLLAEFGVRARARGAVVLGGRATEAGRRHAFQPFADAFADLGSLGHARTGALPPEVLPPEVLGEPSARERFAVCRETAAALARLPRLPRTAPGPVLVLDDLHWADGASLELLDHLVRHPVPPPFLLVVARRPRQTPPALASALARGDMTGAVTRIALGPLTRRDCIAGLAGGLPPERAGRIHEEAEGNPLYVLALLDAAAREEGEGLLAGPLGLVLDELAPLSPHERGVVEAVAVLGEHAGTDLLAAVTEGGPGAGIGTGGGAPWLGAALAEAVRRDLVRTDGRGRRLAPRHPLVGRAVRAAMDPWRRQDLHRRAADELARAGAPLVDQAHHIERSLTRWDPEAAGTLASAAEQTAGSAPALAARWLDVVLGVLPDVPEHRGIRCELMLQRARALGAAGEVRESRDLLHRLLALRDTGPGPGADGVRASALVLCAFMERHLGRYPEAGALLQREVDRRPGPPPERRLALVVEWGNHALFATRFPEVREELARTLAGARERGDEPGTAELLTLAAMGEAYEGATETARGHATEAAALTDVMTDGALVRQGESLVRLGWSEVFLDRYADAERHAGRGVDVTRRTGRPFALSQLLLCAAYTHCVTGRVTSAVALADEAVAAARTLGGGELLGFTRAIRSMILMQSRPPGDPEVRAAAEEAVATVEGEGGFEAGHEGGWWTTLARCMAAYAVLGASGPGGAGDPGRAREMLLRAGGGPALPRVQPSVRPNFLELLVTASLATGASDEAERAAALAAEEAERLGLPTQRGAALRARGLVAAARGGPEGAAEAARAFAGAARESAASGAALREAQSLLLGAPYARAAGDAERAAAMWRRGHQLATAGGARLLAGLAAHTRTAALGADASGTAGGRLAELTRREREIAGLVAEGLTNQAVAEKLCLSTRTVESHVARVYRKTGVSSRAALATLVAVTSPADTYR